MGHGEACAAVNLRAAKSIWSNQLTRGLRALLSALTIQFGFSVTHFIKHLAEYAQSDREGLLCQLNSHASKPASKVLVTIANDSTAAEPEKAAGAA